MKSIAILALAAVLASCALPASGPLFEAAVRSAPANAVVYVSRESRLAMGARPAYFHVNDVNVFDLSPGGYSWIELPPGTYRIRQSWPVDMLVRTLESTITLKAGDTRFLSLETGGGGCGYQQICFHWSLTEDTPEAGWRRVSTKRFQENFGLDKLKQAVHSP